MTHSDHRESRRERALAVCVWLYGLFLTAYPVPFRRAYGERLVRVFRDSCRATLTERGLLFLVPLWGHTVADLVWTASGERLETFMQNAGAMASSDHLQPVPARLWIALASTLLAFGVELVASLHLYLLEDASPLSQAAYGASPLVRFSYDALYLSALASGIAVCALVGSALIRRQPLVTLGSVLLTLVVALGGFGGLLVRHPASFVVFLLLLVALTLSSFLLGRMVMTRSRPVLGSRPAAVLGACVAAGALLLINLAAVVLHTLSLNPVSHALYMQGQIAGTHLNFSLLVLGPALVAGIACLICLWRAFRLPSPQS